MTKKRDIFAELTEGFDALKSEREGKLMALRDAARQGFAAIERGEYLTLQSDQDITTFVRQASREATSSDAVSSQAKRD